ncbi:MAG: hypothetical protein LBF91_03515 [Azoarcus sp.]|jgi:hypothetical protein|nr:hypothetical protein [Azoarcus sp.]
MMTTGLMTSSGLWRVIFQCVADLVEPVETCATRGPGLKRLFMASAAILSIRSRPPGVNLPWMLSCAAVGPADPRHRQDVAFTEIVDVPDRPADLDHVDRLRENLCRWPPTGPTPMTATVDPKEILASSASLTWKYSAEEPFSAFENFQPLKGPSE